MTQKRIFEYFVKQQEKFTKPSDQEEQAINIHMKKMKLSDSSSLSTLSPELYQNIADTFIKIEEPEGKISENNLSQLLDIKEELLEMDYDADDPEKLSDSSSSSSISDNDSNIDEHKTDHAEQKTDKKKKRSYKRNPNKKIGKEKFLDDYVRSEKSPLASWIKYDID